MENQDSIAKSMYINEIEATISMIIYDMKSTSSFYGILNMWQKT